MATNFKLWLDTAAPTQLSMTIPGYGNENQIAVMQSISDTPVGTGQTLYMKLWASTSKTASASEAAAISWETYSSTKVIEIPLESNVVKTYYVHAMYMDSVRNVSQIYTDDDGYLYVTKLPEISNKVFPTKVTADENLTFSFNATQYSTGFAEIKVTGPKGTIKTTTTSPVSFTGLGKTYLNEGNNILTISVKDSAGNTKTETVTVLYDTQETTGTFYFGKSASDATAISYSNASEGNVYLYVNTTSTDFASITYKVMCGTTTIVAQATKSSGLTPSSGHIYIGAFPTTGKIDGTWVVSGTYLDTAGVSGGLTNGQVIRDTIAPTISNWTEDDPWYINGNLNTCYPTPHQMTFKLSDATSGISNPLNWDVKWVDDSVKSNFTMSGPDASGKYTLTQNDGFNTGVLYYLYIYDVAGNEAEQRLEEPTMDEASPTVNVALSDSAIDVSGKGKCLASTTTPIKTFNATDSGSGLKSVQIKWSQSSSTPSSWDTVTGTSGNYVTAVNEKWSNTNANGIWYLHYKAVDNVNNVTTNKISFLYDTVAPTGSITGPSTSVSRQITLSLSANDGAGSGVTKMKVTSSAISDGDTSWVNFTTSRTVTIKDTETAGSKVIKVQYMDAVGNISTEYSYTVNYDSSRMPTIQILTTGNVDAGNYTKVLPFHARIGDSSGDVSIYAEYKIYGDFSTSTESTAVTPEPETWTTFTADSGQQYRTINNLYFSKNDGVKSVKVKVKNADGFIYTEVVDVITLDRTPPTITLTNASSNIISNIHETRQGTTLTGDAAYANIVTFQFSCDEVLQAYKVCVVDTSATDSQTASEAAEAIGTANGSVNMTGANVAKDATVYCTLVGADLMAHSLVDSTDGAYIVGVYGKDLAGLWSLIGTIAT